MKSPGGGRRRQEKSQKLGFSGYRNKEDGDERGEKLGGKKWFFLLAKNWWGIDSRMRLTDREKGNPSGLNIPGKEKRPI